MTDGSRISAANRSSFSSNSWLYCDSSKPNSGNDSVNEPRPRITSARPFEAASTVEKRWKTRMGSSELSTVTAEPSLIRVVRLAIAASTVLGRRHREVGPVVLAHAEKVDAQPVGQHRLLDDVADDLGVRQQAAVGPAGHVAEGVQAKFQRLRHRIFQGFAKGSRPI